MSTTCAMGGCTLCRGKRTAAGTLKTVGEGKREPSGDGSSRSKDEKVPGIKPAKGAKEGIAKGFAKGARRHSIT